MNCMQLDVALGDVGQKERQKEERGGDKKECAEPNRGVLVGGVISVAYGC